MSDSDRGVSLRRSTLDSRPMRLRGALIGLALVSCRREPIGIKQDTAADAHELDDAPLRVRGTFATMPE